MNRTEVAQRVAALLTDDPADALRLRQAILTAYYDQIEPLQSQLQAYSILGTYYGMTKDKKRPMKGTDKFAWQLVEDVLEGWLKALDRGIIATQHLNNLTGRHNA